MTENLTERAGSSSRGDRSVSTGKEGCGKYLLGAHLSISKGIHTLQHKMNVLQIPTCALFLKSQRTFNFKKINGVDVKKFKEHVRRPDLLLPHSSYLVNLANPEIGQGKGLEVLQDDLERCNLLGIKLYNIHPGSDVKKLGRKALSLISHRLNEIFAAVPGVTVLVENMAGQGKVVGSTFGELKEIIEGVVDKSRIGVCLDTCHLFGAGYDVRTAESFGSVMREFDRTVGLEYLRAMHLNDSKAALGSRKDRHESIGKGQIGLGAFRFVMTSKMFENMPLVLETPDPALYGEEIRLLESLQSTMDA